jgi:hypothetical protein
MKLKSYIKIIVLFLTVSIVFLSSGCYNDNKEELYIKFSCDTGNVSYNNNIQKMFASRCVSCHNGSHATCNLNNYTNSHAYAIKPGTNLYTKVKNGDHNNQVLDDCEKSRLRIWISTGAN